MDKLRRRLEALLGHPWGRSRCHQLLAPLVGLSLALGACTQDRAAYHWQLAQLPEAAGGERRQAFVGVAEVDITPELPGSNAGFSTNGYTAEGIRDPLKARAFYMGFNAGPPIVVVQLDLLSGSWLLHHQVAAALAKDGIVDPSGLLLAGTHSHGGPGNFFGSDFYNGWAGTTGGLNQAYFDDLSQQVIAAVRQAFHSRRPGTIHVATKQVHGLTRNRSLAAFRANKTVTDKAIGPLAAVNPLLSVVRLDAWDAGQLKPLGGFGTFSIHGTSVDQSPFYHGDLFAYASRAATAAIKGKFPQLPWEPVIAMLNRTHGDNSPNYTEQGFAAAAAIGGKLGLETAGLMLDIEIEPTKIQRSWLAFKELDLSAEIAAGAKDLCEPKVGMSLTAGAEDGPTPILSSLPWFAEGWPQEESYYECQGQKRVLGSVLQNLVVAPEEFPRYAMVQVLNIDGFVLITLPYEVTYEMGRRLKRPLLAAGFTAEQVAVVSCANGYFGYLTTPEEYALQHYEGGHSLYGPRTGIFFEDQVAQLMAKSPSKASVAEKLPAVAVSLVRQSGVEGGALPATDEAGAGGAWLGDPELLTTAEGLMLRGRFRLPSNQRLRDSVWQVWGRPVDGVTSVGGGDPSWQLLTGLGAGPQIWLQDGSDATKVYEITQPVGVIGAKYQEVRFRHRLRSGEHAQDTASVAINTGTYSH